MDEIERVKALLQSCFCTGCKERQDRIEALQAEVERLSASTYADGVEDAARWVQDNWPHDKRTLVPAIRALKEV